MFKIRTLFLVLLACIALIAVACGGDDDDAADDDANTDAEEATNDDDGADDDDDADQDDGDADDSDDADGDAGGEDSAAAVDGEVFFDLCDGQFDQSALGGLTGLDMSNPDMEASMKATVAQFEEIANAAPDEIKADFQTVAEVFAQFDAVLSEFDYDFLALATDPSAQEKFSEVESSFDSDEAEEASDNIEAWMEENCTPLG
jgi:hypothetical protein